MRKNGVQALLMGGQACVFYGAAEFSRDLDLLALVNAQNLIRLRQAVDELEAQVIAVPPFDEQFLQAGHAVHFRCGRADVAGLRIDVMARLRGVDGFEQLWRRRTVIEVGEQIVHLLGLEDLVRAKKTQRDKDWPMIRRLAEQNYLEHRGEPTPERVRFWMRELRTPELLIEAAARWPRQAQDEAVRRSAVAGAVGGRADLVVECLELEERQERERDRLYWQPLRRELERLRHEL